MQPNGHKRLDSFKYLGVEIDSRFSFEGHVKTQTSKANKRMYFLRTMRNMNVDKSIMHLFYASVIEPVLLYSFVSFYNMITHRQKHILGRPIVKCHKIMYNCTGTNVDVLFESSVLSMCKKIMSDETHPLHSHFIVMPRSHHLRSHRCRTTRMLNTSVPSCIRAYNSHVWCMSYHIVT